MVGKWAKRLSEYNAPSVNRQLAHLLQNPDILGPMLSAHLPVPPAGSAALQSALRTP